MSSLVNELNSLDFSVLIGGPINAAVEAQNNASLAQIKFIQEVGLISDGDDKKLVMVDFSYNSNTEDNGEDNPGGSGSSGNGSGSGNNDTGDTTGDTTGNTTGNTTDKTSVNRHIRVPLLTMLNVPSLRIDEMTIDFNAKLTSVETASSSQDLSGNATLSLSYAKVASLKASAAYQKKSSSGSQVEKTYSMVIHVRVVNDDLPAGLDRVLSLLENAASIS